MSAVNQEFDVHTEGPVRAERTSVTGDENDFMLDRRRTYERVVDGSTGNPAHNELRQQDTGSFSGKEAAFREVGSNQSHHRCRRPPSRGRQARQHRERLEDRMPRKAENPVAECLSRRLVLLVIADNKRHRHAGVNKRIGGPTAGRHHATFERPGRRW